MDSPDFYNETWHCNACEEDFGVIAGSYNLDDGDWPQCLECDSDSTEML